MNDSTCPECDSPLSCGDEAEQHFLCGSWLEDGELFTSEACTIIANLRTEVERWRAEYNDLIARLPAHVLAAANRFAPTDLGAECLRLRKERDDARNECESAALRGEMRAVTSIVAWLHAVAQQERERGYGLTADILDQHADAIERGEYEGSGDGRP